MMTSSMSTNVKWSRLQMETTYNTVTSKCTINSQLQNYNAVNYGTADVVNDLVLVFNNIML